MNVIVDVFTAMLNYKTSQELNFSKALSSLSSKNGESMVQPQNYKDMADSRILSDRSGKESINKRCNSVVAGGAAEIHSFNSFSLVSNLCKPKNAKHKGFC